MRMLNGMWKSCFSSLIGENNTGTCSRGFTFAIR